MTSINRNDILARPNLAAALLPALLSSSTCKAATVSILHPASAVALSQRNLIFAALAMMLIVIVPVWVMTIWFPWRYRSGGDPSNYNPDVKEAWWVETIIWVVPAIIVLAIGSMVWIYTHRLDPYRPIASTEAPLKIEAVALDWKWVFLYPDDAGATVNELVVPVGRPVELAITSDTAMNSLLIPGLAGQIYAMAGMKTFLNFKADRAAAFTGRNTQFTGGSFPEQKFAVRTVTPEGYRQFLDRLAKSPQQLTADAYARLRNKRAVSPVELYSRYEPHLFSRVIAHYCATDCRSTPLPTTK